MRVAVGSDHAGFLLKENLKEYLDELGHHIHHDIWKSIALQTATTLVALWLTYLCLGALTYHHGLLPPPRMPVA